MSHTNFPLLMKTAIMSAAVLAVFTIQPVQAQEVPPSEAQLLAPGASSAAPILPAPGDITAPEQPNARRNASGGAGDPCPAPESALNNAPDDLAKVQEDIDRFTLCVQRAQLLERLNESVLRNSEAADVALGHNPAMAGVAGAQQNGMPPAPGGMMPNMQNANLQAMSNGMAALPANALGGADVTPGAARPALPEGAGDVPDQITPSEVVEKKEPEKPKEWTIREVFGSGNEVRARLLSPDGDEVKAYNGMRLPDGKTTVVRITPGGVTVRGEKGAQTLEWSKS